MRPPSLSRGIERQWPKGEGENKRFNHPPIKDTLPCLVWKKDSRRKNQDPKDKTPQQWRKKKEESPSSSQHTAQPT